MKTKSKKITARRMWAGDEVPGDIVRDKALVSVNITSRPSWGDTPYFILPATPESYDQLIEQAHTAIANDPDYACIAHHQWLDLVHTVFTSAGITRPKK